MNTNNKKLGIGVLGTNLEPRSKKDNQLIADFSCSRENFTLKPVEGVTGEMIYPRSSKDISMLKKYNTCPCKEQFQYKGGKYDQQAKKLENYCLCGRDCPGCPMCKGCKNCPNCTCRESYCNVKHHNPYNNSGNISYVPLK